MQQQLDLVMLTNGWRRINWDKVVKNKFPAIKYQNDADYLSLSGKVYGATELELKKGAIILMIINNKLDTANRIEQVIVDGTGNFRTLILFCTIHQKFITEFQAQTTLPIHL